MSEVAEQVYQLLSQSLGLEDGDAQIALREEAVRLADLGGDLKLQYFAREVFVRACIFGGATEKGLVAFAWLLAQFDNHPGRFDQWGILWKYKWINGVICDFPQVSKKRIYEMIDDLEQRAVRAGYGLRAITNERYRAEKFWDNREKAIEYFRKLEELPADTLSNCPLCETDERVSFAIYCGNDERALDLAGPILNGDEKCGSVPHRTYANLLLPLIRLGRHNEALRYHLKSFRLIANNKAFLDKIADHLICLALTENFKQAIALVETHYAWTESNRDLFSHFRFFRAAWLLFEMLTEREGSLNLNMPRSFPLYAEAGDYDAARLAAWFKEKAEGIAKRFDRRNETDFFARTLAETVALKLLRVSFPMDDPAPPGKDEIDQRALEGSDPRASGSESKVPPAEWFPYIADVYDTKAKFPVAGGKDELLRVDWQYERLFYVEQVPLLTNVVSLGDIVEMEWNDGDIIPHFKRVVEASGQRTVRVDLATSDREQYFSDFLAALKRTHPDCRQENKLVTFAIEDRELDEDTREWLAYLHVSWVYTDTLSQA